MTPRIKYSWKCRNRTLQLGERTWIMGILNVTPDSFSDGGQFNSQDQAVEHALKMIEQGADIIDIGGESTRPGADPVSEADEIQRTVPVIKKLRGRTDIPISIDTMKAAVAEQALQAGANIINDVSALEADTRMVDVAAQSEAGIILMHKKGSPKTMQDNPVYSNIVEEITTYLNDRIQFAVDHGVAPHSICIDPGLGFGKTLDHNVDLMRQISEFEACHCPVLIGASRKTCIGTLTDRKNPEDRVAGSLGAAAWSVMQGAHILRVHDVIETCDVCRIMDTLCTGDF